jgi:two-component system LytT family sensor kinase
MLRYQLYECGSEKVPLQNEIDYIRNYIHLQQLRKDERYKVDFNLPINVDGAMVAPFLLLPLVENMFKHVSHWSDQINFIEGSLQISAGRLHFRGVNSKSGSSAPFGAADQGRLGGRTEHGEATANGESMVNGEATANGIGLANVKRRLELLYPHQHILQITDDPTAYTVNLEVAL